VRKKIFKKGHEFFLDSKIIHFTEGIQRNPYPLGVPKSIWLPMMRHSASENPKLEVRIPKNALGLSHTQHGIPKAEGMGG